MKKVGVKMKQVIAIALLAFGLVSNASASVVVYNSSNTHLGHFNDVKCGTGLSCTKVAGKALVQTVGGLETQYSTSGDLSSTQCGMTITSDNTVGSAGGPIDLFNLPAISSSTLGCRYTFIVGVPSVSNQQLQINPQNANQILILGSSAGDAISADLPGESIVLEALPTGWAPVGAQQGTWTDIN